MATGAVAAATEGEDAAAAAVAAEEAAAVDSMARTVAETATGC